MAGTYKSRTQPVVELLETQADFVISDSPRYIGFTGGFRSGKTHSLCHKAIRLASINVGQGTDGALLSPTKDMYMRVVVPTMNSILQQVGFKPVPTNKEPKPGTYQFWGSDAPRYIIHFPHGSFKIWLLAAESAEARAVGISLSWFGIDEFDKIERLEDAQAAWNIMISRLTRGKVMQGFVTSTPEGFRFLNWFFNEDIVREDGTLKTDRRLIIANTEDNPYIDPEYCERLREQYPAKLIEAYIKGQFVNLATGNVYYAFDRALNGTTATINQFHPSFPLSIGIDFNIGKMASTVSIIDNNNIVHVIDEIYGEDNTDSLIKEIRRRYPGRAIHCYPDNNAKSAGISPYILLQNAGFHVFKQNQNPRVADRYNAVNAMFCNSVGYRKIFVNVQRCPKLVKSLEQQGFVNGEPDKGNNLDHIVDALGYMIHKKFPIRQPNSGSIKVVAG